MSWVAEVGVEGRLAGLDSNHEAVLDARAELIEDLRSVAGAQVIERAVPVAGAKGAAGELVIALSSAGAVTGLVQIVKAWLQRDRRRSVTVSVTNSETGRVVQIDGDAVSNDVLVAALNGRELPPASQEGTTTSA